MLLDLGAGTHPKEGYVGMDIQESDIVWDMETLPWPIGDCVCDRVNASHVLEHISPKKIMSVMNEIWRISKPGAELDIRTPYGDFYKFDPTHQIEFWAPSWLYFCPENPDYYNIYKPKPWKRGIIEVDEPNMELHTILTKLETA